MGALAASRLRQAPLQDQARKGMSRAPTFHLALAGRSGSVLLARCLEFHDGVSVYFTKPYDFLHGMPHFDLGARRISVPVFKPGARHRGPLAQGWLLSLPRTPRCVGCCRVEAGIEEAGRAGGLGWMVYT